MFFRLILARLDGIGVIAASLLRRLADSFMQKNTKEALKAAFPVTIPVLTGYIFLGMGYGVLMSSIGYGLGWTVFMSLLIFAGSIQYISIALLTSAFNPLYTLLLTLMVNARHLFYGISMLERYKGAGRLKPYLVFGLTDETFSLLSAVEPPEGISRKWFQFFVTMLNHVYWVVGSALGNILGSMISFNTKGLDFVLTALFAVIFIDQWRSTKNHIPALVGVGGSLLCLLIFGQDNFMIPAMVLILLLLTALRKRIDEAYSGANLDYCCSIGLGDGNYTDTALLSLPAEQGDTGFYTVSWPGVTVCGHGAPGSILSQGSYGDGSALWLARTHCHSVYTCSPPLEIQHSAIHRRRNNHLYAAGSALFYLKLYLMPDI